MFSWKSSFFLQFILDKYEKEVDDEKKEKLIRALVIYNSPELIMKFVSAKGNPLMLSPNIAYNLYSIIIDYCIDVDYQINSATLIQIIDYLMKILSIRQVPKLFQKIEPFFFVIFGNTNNEYPEQEVEKIYQTLKGISPLPLSFFSLSSLSHLINQNHKNHKKIFKKLSMNSNDKNNDDKNYIASETFLMLISSADTYLTSPKNACIWIESISAILRSEKKIEYDLSMIYSVCDKISMTESSSKNSKFTWNYKDMSLYFKSHFFDSLSYFLTPIYSLQIAKNHFLKLSSQIDNQCTVEDLSSFIQYSKHIVELRKDREISSFTIDMICEIIFSLILPHFRKSKKLEDVFYDFCAALNQKKLENFVNTHFTTCSISAQKYLISHFPNDDQDIEVLFLEPIDTEIIHFYLSSSKSVRSCNSPILKYLVHFFEFANLADFKYLTPLYKINPYLFCAKVIQYMSICDNFEKMAFLVTFLMDKESNNEENHTNCPIVVYSQTADNNNNNNETNLNDSTSIISLDLAFLSVMYEAIQFPGNQSMKFVYCFLDYLRHCKQSSVNSSYSPKTIAQALNQKFDSASSSSSNLPSKASPTNEPNTKDESSPKTPKILSSPFKTNDNLERTPVRTPKMTRRLSIDKQPALSPTTAEQEEQAQAKEKGSTKRCLSVVIPKRRLSDADSSHLPQNSPYGRNSPYSRNSPYGGNSPFSPINSELQKEINQTKNSLVRQSSREMFSTPKKFNRRKFKSKYFDIDNHYAQMENYYSNAPCFYIKELVNSVKFWDESLLSLLYTKIADGDLHFGVLVSFFTKTFSVINQIGKIISTSPKLLKLFFATTLTMNNEFIQEIMKYLFFHGDLIGFRIELVLHSLLAVKSIKKIDDTIYEILKIGFSNNCFDLTCNVISSLFKTEDKKLSSEDDSDESNNDEDDFVNNCKITNLNLYGSGLFKKKMFPIFESDPEEVLLIMCENYSKCDFLSFINALQSIINSCYKTMKYKLSSEKAMKIVSHSLIESSIALAHSNSKSDIEPLFLSFLSKKKSQDESYHDSLITAFVKELKSIHTKDFGYFVVLKKLSCVLSLDELKPLFSRLFLNISVDKQNNEISEIIKETFSIIFKNNELSNLVDYFDFIDETSAMKIIQDMFDTINFQDENEKESLFICFRKISNLYPKGLINAQPPIIPQIISTYSDISSSTLQSNSNQNINIKNDKLSDSDSEDNSESELDSTNLKKEIKNHFYNNKLGIMFSPIFSILAETDLVMFFNQLTLSPKCSFFDRIILDICQCEDKEFQLFACIENEFSELIDGNINYQFIFQILDNYIKYQPNLQKNDAIDLFPELIGSLLYVLFLCISESFISNNTDILVMLQNPIKNLEVLISIPLMPLSNINSFDKIIEIIPYPMFPNKVIITFLSKCVKLHSSKHHQHLEKLIELMIVSFAQNEIIFPKLVSIYMNSKLSFNHSQFNPKISHVLSSQKMVSKLLNSDSNLRSSNQNVSKKQIIKDIYNVSVEKKSFDSALNSVILIDEASFYDEFLLKLNSFDSINFAKSSAKFLTCIKKSVKFGILQNETIVKNIIDFAIKDIFNEDCAAFNILNICFSQEESNEISIEDTLRNLFYYLVGKGNINSYLQFSSNSLKEFIALKEVKQHELEVMFYILVNLIGIKGDEINEVLSQFFDSSTEFHFSKEASAIHKSIVKQFEEDKYNISFPSISILDKDKMFNI